MEKITDADYTRVANILDWKVPQDSIQKIIMSIQKASDLQDYWDSQYTRPTFTKVILLIVLAISSFVWLLFPVYKVLLSNDEIKVQKDLLLETRNWLTNRNFAFQMKIQNTTTWSPQVVLYDENGTNVLAKSSLINNEAFLISEKTNSWELWWDEKRIIKISNVDLSEDIRQDVINVVNNNINVKDTYMDFQPIDFWVDTLINATD